MTSDRSGAAARVAPEGALLTRLRLSFRQGCPRRQNDWSGLLTEDVAKARPLLDVVLSGQRMGLPVSLIGFAPGAQKHWIFRPEGREF